jgi:hypothetical protein
VCPRLTLSSVGEQVHDDGTPGNGFVHLEEVGARYPAILNGLLPRLTIFPHTDDDVEAVVAEVQALAVTLRSVSDEGKSVVLEVVLRYEISKQWFTVPFLSRPAKVTHEELLSWPVITLCKGRQQLKIESVVTLTYHRPSRWFRQSQLSSHRESAGLRLRQQPLEQHFARHWQQQQRFVAGRWVWPIEPKSCAELCLRFVKPFWYVLRLSGVVES